MIRLHADQLNIQLKKSLYPCYFLFGDDLFLLQESQDCIQARAKNDHFNEYFSSTLDPYTDWEILFNLCRTQKLFSKRQILLLIFPDYNIQSFIEKKLFKLISLLHNDLLLILRSVKFTSELEKTDWFKAIKSQVVLVNCFTPQKEQLLLWVKKRAKTMQLSLYDNACKLLCCRYENNLLTLVQTLEWLSLIYPDGSLTVHRVKPIIHDSAHFKIFQWIDAVLEGESNRATYILYSLKLEAIEPLLLLRSIQREVLQLLMLQKEMKTIPIQILFTHRNILKRRRSMVLKALSRLTFSHLKSAVGVMTNIELALKKESSYSVWLDLNLLVLLLCGKKLSMVMFDN